VFKPKTTFGNFSLVSSLKRQQNYLYYFTSIREENLR